MNKQLSFFQTSSHDGNTTTKLARRNDPETSKQAAEKVKVSANERLFLLAAAKQSFPQSQYYIAVQSIAYSNEETTKQTDKRRETVRKRTSGLVEKELIKVVERSYCSHQESECNKYTITKKGRESIR